MSGNADATDMAITSRFSASGNSALRMLSMSQRAVGQSLERLATGKRINRASDDPAGVIVVTEMDARRSTIESKIKRLEISGYSYGAKEGGLSALSDMLNELEDKVVLAANRGGRSKEELNGMQKEVDETLDAIDFLSYSQKFRDEMVLQGYHTATLGSSGDENGHGAGMLSALKTGGEFDLLTGDMESAQKIVRGARDTISNARAEAGLAAKASDSEIRTLQEELTNLSGAKSQIEDVDYASEVSTLVRKQVQQAAAEYIMRMTMDLQRQSVLSLLG